MPKLLLTPQERIGTLLAGKYQFDRILGQGGMGTVYGGTHTWVSRPVAIKLLNPELAEDGEVVERFLWEARAAAQVRHPNVVDVLDMGRADDGTVYMVLEWLEGEPLSALLDRERTLRLERLLRILLPVMGALAAAHDAGIVHRDIKPDNIFLSRDRNGRLVPKLLDFGVAKIQRKGGSKVTALGLVIGTPHYMSPEQAIGEGGIGPQADVWSLGVVMYECLSGELPITGETSTSILVKLATQDAPPLSRVAPHVPPLVAAVVDRALVRDRDVRWPSVSAFIEALAQACQSSGVALDETGRMVLAEMRGDPIGVSSGSLAPPLDVTALGARASQEDTADARRTPGASAVMTTPSRPLHSQPPASGSRGTAGAEVVTPAASERPGTGFSWSGHEPPRAEVPSTRGRTLVVASSIGLLAIGGVVAALLIVTSTGAPPDATPEERPRAARPTRTTPDRAELRERGTRSAAHASAPTSADEPSADAPEQPAAIAAAAADAGAGAADLDPVASPSSTNRRDRDRTGRASPATAGARAPAPGGVRGSAEADPGRRRSKLAREW